MPKILTAFAIIILLSAGNAYSQNTAQQEAAVASLSPEKVALFKSMMESQHAKTYEVAKKAKAITKTLKSILLAKEFDKSAYIAKSEELTNLHAEKFKARSQAIAELATKLSANERQILVNAFSKRKFSKNPKKKNSL